MAYKRGALQKVEKQFNERGYKIRYERGNFKAGYCVVQDSKVIIINKFYNNEARYNCLIEIMNANGLAEDFEAEETKQAETEQTDSVPEDEVTIT